MHGLSLKGGDLQGALAQYERASQLNPMSPTLYFNLGSIYDYRGDTQKAIEYYRKALSMDQNMVQARENLIKCYEGA